MIGYCVALTSLSLSVERDGLLCLDPRHNGVVRQGHCVRWLVTVVLTKEGCSNIPPVLVLFIMCTHTWALAQVIMFVL